MRFFNLFTSARTEIVNKKSIDVALCGRSEHPQNQADATPCLSDVYNIGTQARRRLADVRLSGRSMVEMLGVLAIIGVLSVGAIAGYSKAMFKYKLNRQTEQLNTVINTVGRNVLNFRGTTGLITSYFIKMGEIPTEMIKKNENNFIYDIFNNSLYIHSSPASDSNREAISLFLNSSGLETSGTRSLEICRNFIITAKENSGSFSTLQTLSGWGTDDAAVTNLWGDSWCTSSRTCLKNITLDEIYKACTMHIGKNEAHMKIIWFF